VVIQGVLDSDERAGYGHLPELDAAPGQVVPGHDLEWDHRVRAAHRRPGALLRVEPDQHPIQPRLAAVEAEPGDQVIGGAYRIDRVLCAFVAFGGHEPVREVLWRCGTCAKGYPRAVHVQAHRPGRFV